MLAHGARGAGGGRCSSSSSGATRAPARLAAAAIALGSLRLVLQLPAFTAGFRAGGCRSRDRDRPAHVRPVGRPTARPLRAFDEQQTAASSEEAYALDDEYNSAMRSLAKSEDLGPLKYYASSDVAGVPIVDSPGGEPTDQLMPGDVVAAEAAGADGHVRLADGRGWLQLGEGVEEVHPWAAKLMKKPGIEQNDAAALAYLSLDPDAASLLTEHLPLPSRVAAEMTQRGISSASPIQEAVFSRVHRGESLCLQSQTGSGKTLAMMLPLLTAMSEESEWGKHGDKVVVVTSCRELAVQLLADIDNIGFFPAGEGYSTVVVVGNLPPTESILRANVIIGTPNELGGVLHKEPEIIKQMNTQLRAIVMDEVDDYTTAPRLFASKWNIKKKRKVYNEMKMTLNNRLGDYDTGKIEWFVKRSLAYCRRRDLQVLAASATLSRNMARKVYRLLRWDPLGRWYNRPPPLMRPVAAMQADWQAIPRVPTVPLQLEHRYVQVVKAPTDIAITDRHFTRKPYGFGGLPRLRIRAASGQRRGLFGQAGRPIKADLAASLLDGLHDALKARRQGSCLLLICRTVGLTVRDTVSQLRRWGFQEAEGLHDALWEDPKDWPSRWAQKYTYDQQDHAAELAETHRSLNERLKAGEHRPLPLGSPESRELEERKQAGEATSPILVGFEGNGRGLHFDGVETVYILGLPRKPAAYLHLAGRVGRLGQQGSGKVISVLPKRGSKVLEAWAAQIGPGVRFEAEPIQRIRSAPVDTPPLSDEERALEKDERRQRSRERRARRRTREPALLPEAPEYVQVPAQQELQLEPELEPVREPVPEPVRDEWLSDFEHPRRELEEALLRRMEDGPPRKPP